MMNTNGSYFFLRRIHSLLGVFPLGIFLVNHLLTNSSAIISPEFFEEKVRLIHMLGPLLPIVEAAFIFIPLSLHIALGVYIALTARNESGANMPYARNWAYKAQRWTGWIALVFIVYHVIHLRFLHDMDAEPFSVVLARMFSDGIFAIPIMLAYFIGGTAVVYHFANGLCTFCMSWGITVGPKSQQNMARFAIGVGAALMLMLVTSIYSFNSLGRKLQGMNETDRTAYVNELLLIHADEH